MVKPSRARMRSAVLLGSLLALLPALPALAADPTPAAEAPGPQLRAGSLMLIPAPSNVQAGQGSGITVRADTVLQAEGEVAQRVAAQFADLLARSVVVVDTDGTVLHTELVPEIGTEPDYDAAVAALG